MYGQGWLERCRLQSGLDRPGGIRLGKAALMVLPAFHPLAPKDVCEGKSKSEGKRETDIQTRARQRERSIPYR